MEHQKRFMRLPEVQRTVGLGRSAIYERVASQSFPAPVPLGGRAVGWLQDEIEKWCDEQVKASRHAA